MRKSLLLADEPNGLREKANIKKKIKEKEKGEGFVFAGVFSWKHISIQRGNWESREAP